MGKDDEPESESVGGLKGFVTEVRLGEKCGRPATDEFEEVELGFGDSPTTGLCAFFIVRVGKPGGE